MGEHPLSEAYFASHNMESWWAERSPAERDEWERVLQSEEQKREKQKEADRRAARRRPFLYAFGIALGVYALLWLGGTLSYGETHKCVRWETVARDPGDYDGGPGQPLNTSTTQRVCAYTQDNGRRWTIFGPITALYSR
jgi:hypothetical protein